MLNAMIVEDNAIYRYAIKTIIRWEDYGFQIVSEALNGVHALDLLQQQHVDLIVTDISMPEMNGIDLIQQVKHKDASIKIVALSSYDDFRFVKEALKLGAEDYLLKHDLEPETLQQLLQLMNSKILEDHEQRKQAQIREANLHEMRCLLGRKLLLGELKSAEEIASQACAVRFPFKQGPTAAIVIDGAYPRSADHSASEETQAMITLAIPITNQKTVVMISFAQERSERKCREDTLHQASLFLNRLQDANKATVGISTIGYGLKDWAVLYQQAEAALIQSVYGGAGQIYTYTCLPLQEVESAKSKLSVHFVAAAMRNGSVAEAETQAELFFHHLLDVKPPIDELKNVLTEIILLVKTSALERHRFSEQVEQLYKQMMTLLEPLPQLNEIKRLMLEANRRIFGPYPYENTSMRKEIQTAMAYIEEHYAEDITVVRLAEVLHLSSNYLSNLFKSETGMRIVEYMNRCRIRRAKLLLQDASMKVYEVAEKTGFQEASYFCKVFKELEGKTVKEYRSER
ncbi:response regulator [Paenibacillus sp. HWE-109]|uniref:response regulator n=1 Tax=Paenibacillus sp. HWE-109 TaxID=1306526 RepID=UPI001EDF51B1|nr:response regulator [Paenibacillus sp. HWE-109]UKS28854.1 response regulator [Paenibacillus sp. HWE-109]